MGTASFAANEKYGGIMTAIVCVSDGGGMMFGGHRVSRDRVVIEDVVRLSSDGVLFASEYSAALFEESGASLIVTANPLASASCGDFAFVEEHSVSEYKDKISELVIYRWNRKYLFDFKLDLDPEGAGMKLAESTEFSGKAHNLITREIWKTT